MPAVLSRYLSRCLWSLINAGQTYTINSSYPFRFGLISLRINRLLLSTSVKSLFLILKCNMVLASSPRSVTDKLQQVLNAAICLVSGTRKYDRRLSQIPHADLHWLNVADRLRYKLGVTVHRCLHNKVPQYLVDCCVQVSDIASHQRLHSHVGAC